MKIRNGFVSNSSSSSFTLFVKDITGKQRQQILCNKTAIVEGWTIYMSDNQTKIVGYTLMDNYDLEHFFQEIGVDLTCVTWGE